MEACVGSNRAGLAARHRQLRKRARGRLSGWRKRLAATRPAHDALVGSNGARPIHACSDGFERSRRYRRCGARALPPAGDGTVRADAARVVVPHRHVREFSGWRIALTVPIRTPAGETSVRADATRRRVRHRNLHECPPWRTSTRCTPASDGAVARNGAALRVAHGDLCEGARWELARWARRAPGVRNLAAIGVRAGETRPRTARRQREEAQRVMAPPRRQQRKPPDPHVEPVSAILLVARGHPTVVPRRSRGSPGWLSRSS
jgi:hypothetical protein